MNTEYQTIIFKGLFTRLFQQGTERKMYFATGITHFLKSYLKISLSLALTLFAFSVQAAPKVFTAQVIETVSLERLYEVRDISFLILKTESDNTFLEGGIIKGDVGLDAVTGRIMVEINELSKAGMSMKAVGYVEDKDKEKGIDACTLWQTRMFEESKLCYAAEVQQGREFKVIVSVETENVLPPVAGQ